jgi:anti-anti-sigma factor
VKCFEQAYSSQTYLSEDRASGQQCASIRFTVADRRNCFYSELNPSPAFLRIIHAANRRNGAILMKEMSAFCDFRQLNMTSGRPVIVKQLPEKLSVEQGCIFFREVEPSLKGQRPRVVLDCSKVRQLDSTGIQVLLHCLEEAMKRNGDVKLAAVPPAAAAILKLTRVDHLFEAFDDTDTAVSSFYQFPVPAFQQGPCPAFSAAASTECSDSGNGPRTRAGVRGFGITRRLSDRWPMRPIAGCCVVLFLILSVAAPTSPEHRTKPRPQAKGASSPAQAQHSDGAAKKGNTGLSQPETFAHQSRIIALAKSTVARTPESSSR